MSAAPFPAPARTAALLAVCCSAVLAEEGGAARLLPLISIRTVDPGEGTAFVTEPVKANVAEAIKHKENDMKTTLVIMAAGIGSRFGTGIKQMESVGPSGELIIDYSIHDAIEAGFNKIVFVIRKDLDKDFREIIGNRTAEKIDVAYAYQDLNDLPVPQHRRRTLCHHQCR